MVSPDVTQLTLMCSLNITIPSGMTITWLHNDSVVTTTMTQVDQNNNTVSLIKGRPRPSDAGVYQCVFNDTTGCILSASITLLIIGKLQTASLTTVEFSASSVASTSNPLLLPHGVTTIATTSVVDLSITATTIHTSSVNTNSQSDSHKANLATRYQNPNIISVTTSATTVGLSITAITTFSHNSPTSQSNNRSIYSSAEVYALISIVSVAIIITIVVITVVVGIVVCHKCRKRRANDDCKQNPINNKPEPVNNKMEEQDGKGDPPEKGPDPIYASYPRTKQLVATPLTCVEVYTYV